METLIVFDSTHANIQVIAEIFRNALKKHGSVKLKSPSDMTYNELLFADVVIVGSPTQRGRPTKQMRAFLSDLPPRALENKDVAAFDTHLDLYEQSAATRLFMEIMGFAAPRISRTLQERKGHEVAYPIGFAVEERQGPLRPGERERAETWITELIENRGAVIDTTQPLLD